MKVGAQRAKVRYSGVGQLIRERRREIGMTQGQLGELVGQDQSQISKVERGETLLSRAEADALAVALDLPLSVVLEAEAHEEQRVSDQLADFWHVSRDPAGDLRELIPRLARPDVETLIRLARVMIAGREAGR